MLSRLVTGGVRLMPTRAPRRRAPASPGASAERAQCRAIERLVGEAGERALASYGASRGALKRDGSWVTRTDSVVERLLRRGIGGIVDARIYGEEEGWSGPAGASHIAIIDPIDGTDAYRNRMPFWGLSIAILKRAGNEW